MPQTRTTPSHLQLIDQRLDESLRAVESIRALSKDVAAVMRCVMEKLAGGGTIYTAGNGGSAAQALHLAEELIGRYRADRPPQRAICLNADPTALTCIANDYGFDQIFARQCEALLTDRDALIVFSTSGNSPNIIEALKTARQRGAATIGILGRGGGDAAALCDHSLIIDGPDSAVVQDAHQVLLHLICEAAEPQTRQD